MDADGFAALCLEPYSRGRILAAYSSSPSQVADAEAAAAGGIATIDLGTKKVVSKVCLERHCKSLGMLKTKLGLSYIIVCT